MAANRRTLCSCQRFDLNPRAAAGPTLVQSFAAVINAGPSPLTGLLVNVTVSGDPDSTPAVNAVLAGGATLPGAGQTTLALQVAPRKVTMLHTLQFARVTHVPHAFLLYVWQRRHQDALASDLTAAHRSHMHASSHAGPEYMLFVQVATSVSATVAISITTNEGAKAVLVLQVNIAEPQFILSVTPASIKVLW